MPTIRYISSSLVRRSDQAIRPLFGARNGPMAGRSPRALLAATTRPDGPTTWTNAFGWPGREGWSPSVPSLARATTSADRSSSVLWTPSINERCRIATKAHAPRIMATPTAEVATRVVRTRTEANLLGISSVLRRQSVAGAAHRLEAASAEGRVQLLAQVTHVDLDD